MENNSCPINFMFIYDSSNLLIEAANDEDDSTDYFYPQTISKERRTILCSQLIGITQFCQSAISVPKVVTLSDSKIAVKDQLNFYIFIAFRTDLENTEIKYYLENFCAYLQFYHYSLDHLLSKSNGKSDFKKKLKCFIDIYIDKNWSDNSNLLNILSYSFIDQHSSNIQELFQWLRKTEALAVSFLWKGSIVATTVEGKNYNFQLQFLSEYLVTENIQIKFNLPTEVNFIRIYSTKRTLKCLNKMPQEPLTDAPDICSPDLPFYISYGGISVNSMKENCEEKFSEIVPNDLYTHFFKNYILVIVLNKSNINIKYINNLYKKCQIFLENLHKNVNKNDSPLLLQTN